MQTLSEVDLKNKLISLTLTWLFCCRIRTINRRQSSLLMVVTMMMIMMTITDSLQVVTRYRKPFAICRLQRFVSYMQETQANPMKC